jgi:hypothetical protein
MLFSNYQDDMRFLNAMDSIANSLALIAEHTKSTQENETRAKATQKHVSQIELEPYPRQCQITVACVLPSFHKGTCQDDVEYW